MSINYNSGPSSNHHLRRMPETFHPSRTTRPSYTNDTDHHVPFSMTNAPAVHSAATDICNDYKCSLMDLAFNSKPIINNLTIIAHENMDFSAEIVKAIESHMLKTPHKLPTLYLIDSICKNIPKTSNYIGIFSKNIVNLFSTTFIMVDDKVKKDFLRVLQTWHNVFDRDTIRQIEERLHIVPPIVSTSTQMPSIPIRAAQAAPKPPTLSSQLYETPRGYYQTVSNAPSLPYSNMSAEVHPYFYPTDSYLQQSHGGGYPQQYSQSSSYRPSSHPISQYSSHPMPAMSYPEHHNVLNDNNIPPSLSHHGVRKRKEKSEAKAVKKTKLSSKQQGPDPHLKTKNTDVAVSDNLLLELQSLLDATAGSSGQLLSDNKQKKKEEESHFRFVPYIEFSYSALQKSYPKSYHYIYEDLALQCRNCGFRYEGTVEGQAALDFHLDCHFKRNKRLNEKSKKMLSRDWFLSEENWKTNSNNTILEKQMSSFFEDENMLEGEEAIKDPRVQAEKIILHDTCSSCAVCGERFETEFDVDLDEWVIKDATKSFENNRAVHIYCIDSSTNTKKDSARKSQDGLSAETKVTYLPIVSF